MLIDLSCVELLGTEINSQRITNPNPVSKRSVTLLTLHFCAIDHEKNGI